MKVHFVFPYIFYLCIFNSFVFSLPPLRSKVVRETRFGKVRGSLFGTVEVYRGVPYAEPPIGPLRFKPPQNPKSWDPLILDTDQDPYACPQNDWGYIAMINPSVLRRSSEDCLYMNIYVPNVTQTALPVLLFVHGGSNIVGTSIMYDGKILAAMGEIIVVTFNYRLGILGFYADKGKDYKGNYGLLDQVKAMTWVTENIRFFNGDPEMITLYGHSAGAADVGLHLVSDLSKGLYKYAVIHSGSPLAFWALSECIVNGKISHNSAECLPLMQNDTRYAKQILARPIHDNFVLTNQVYKSGADVYPPVEDGYFLTDSPEKLFKCSGVNVESVLMVMTRDETMPTRSRIGHKFNDKDDFNEFLSFVENMKTVLPPEFTESVNETFDSWKENNVTRFPHAQHMMSDVLVFAPLIKLADMLSEWMNNIFLLSFEYISDYPRGQFPGVPHGWDMFHVFGNPFSFPNLYSSKDRNVSDRTMQMIANFVKFGVLTKDGTQTLRPYNSSIKSYYKLNYDTTSKCVIVTPEIHFRRTQLNFWNQYLFKYEDFTCNNGRMFHQSTYLTLFLFLYNIQC